MHLGVGNIPMTGRALTLSMSEDWACAAAAQAVGGAVSILQGGLRLDDLDLKVVRVTGSVEVGATLPCDRCGESTEVAVSTEVDLRYAPASRLLNQPSTEEEEIELARDDLDVGWYEGKSLDMAAVLCEAVSLAWPTRVVCSDHLSCEARVQALLEPGKISTSPFAALRNLADT